MTLSHKLKFIFIHVHRTGGSNLISLLMRELGDDLEVLSQHGNAKTAETLYLETFPGYFTFAFVRNPWERMLSWYLLINKWNPQALVNDRLDFEKFLESDHAADPADNYFHYNQLDYLPEDHDLLQNFRVYRFENYEKEVAELFRCLGLPKAEMTKTNETRTLNYRDFYSEKSKRWIEQNCRRDIEYFNYSF